MGIFDRPRYDVDTIAMSLKGFRVVSDISEHPLRANPLLVDSQESFEVKTISDREFLGLRRATHEIRRELSAAAKARFAAEVHEEVVIAIPSTTGGAIARGASGCIE